MMARGMQPFRAAIGQGHVHVLGRDLFARQRANDGSLLRGNRSPLAVAEHVVAPPLLKREPLHALSRPEHLESSLIGEDELALTVNDDQCHAHVVKNAM